MLIANQVVNPVVVGTPNAAGSYDITGDVLGTCFPIGPHFCVTAAHVAAELQARCSTGVGLIGTPRESTWAGAEVVDAELLDADVAVLRYLFRDRPQFAILPTLRWDSANLGVLATVNSIGYPYGTTTVDAEVMIVARAFRGYVVCTIPRYKPIGFAGPAFSVHELSFAAPRGLSGAPLLSDGDPAQVQGLVIGNSCSEMLVHSATDQVSNGTSIERVEHFERLYLGIAVRACHVMALRSRLLGGTIGEHLQAEGLVVKTDA